MDGPFRDQRATSTTGPVVACVCLQLLVQGDCPRRRLPVFRLICHNPDVDERDRKESGAASPLATFAVLLAVVALAAAGANLLAVKDADPQLPSEASARPPESSPGRLLTEAEAVIQLRRLEKLSLRAFETRDPDLAKQLYTESSPVRQRALADIRRLMRDQVRVRVVSRNEQIDVTLITKDKIQAIQEVLIETRFYDAKGADVTRGSGRERQEIEWSLRRIRGAWLIQDAVVVSAEPVE